VLPHLVDGKDLEIHLAHSGESTVKSHYSKEVHNHNLHKLNIISISSLNETLSAMEIRLVDLWFRTYAMLRIRTYR
jgi:hypothetical protein